MSAPSLPFGTSALVVVVVVFVELCVTQSPTFNVSCVTIWVVCTCKTMHSLRRVPPRLSLSELSSGSSNQPVGRRRVVTALSQRGIR